MSFAASDLERLLNPTKRAYGDRAFCYLNRNVDGWPLKQLRESLGWIHSLLGQLLEAMQWEGLSVGHLITYREADEERDLVQGTQDGIVFRFIDSATHVWPLLDADFERQLALNLRDLIGIIETAKWQPSARELEWRTAQEARQRGVRGPITFTTKNGVTTVSYEEEAVAPYLGLRKLIDEFSSRCLTRDGYSQTVDFAKQDAPWELVVALLNAREHGRANHELHKGSSSALGNVKTRANELLQELGVIIERHPKTIGYCWIAEMNCSM